MFCNKCGSSLDAGAHFCPKCGQNVEPAMNSQPLSNYANGQINDEHAPQQPVPLKFDNPAYPYTYNNVKKKPVLQADLHPSSDPAGSGNNNHPSPPYTYHNVKKKPVLQSPQEKPKKKRFRFAIVIGCLLIIAILVQCFAYPFLLQKATFGRISTVALKSVDPDKSTKDGVTEAETKAVVSYARGVRRSLSWQLTGHEKNVYNIASRYLRDATQESEIDASITNPKGSSQKLLASTSPNLMLLSNSPSGDDFSKEEIASDIAGIATLLLQRGYTKLAITLTALAAENSPVDPIIINNLTSALRADGLTGDAKKLLGYAYKLNPNCPEILTNMGNVCLDEGDADGAATWFDMALSIDDNFGLAHEGLMLYYMNQKRYETAMNHMIKASETTFTPAVARTYDRIKNLENYEDIRDNVLKGFDFSEIQKTYQRTRDQAREGIDTPEGQIKIPKFPTYSGIESFIGGIGGMHDYAMSILTPAMDELKKIGEMVKQADEMIKSFQSGGLSGLAKAANDMGLMGGQQEGSGASYTDGKFQVSMDYSRELYTIGLLGDYLDMKVKEPMEKMQEKFKSSGDPLMDMAERSMRELEARGESKEAWLGAMASNWGNSMSLSGSTIGANKANINQHINSFYQAILPAYNEIKPILEEYWLYTGGVIKYAGDQNVFKSLDSQRKVNLYGNLATFAIFAEVEAINVPLMYEMYAIKGNPPPPKPGEGAEKLDKPGEVQPWPDETLSVDIGIVEVEWSNGELEVEVTALLAASVKYNHQKGTVTLAGGVGVSSGDFVPMLGGKATATYYVVLSRNGVNDHGTATKTEYSVGEGVKYKVKTTTTISTVTSAMDTTVEKAITGGKIFNYGFKRTESE